MGQHEALPLRHRHHHDRVRPHRLPRRGQRRRLGWDQREGGFLRLLHALLHPRNLLPLRQQRRWQADPARDIVQRPRCLLQQQHEQRAQAKTYQRAMNLTVITWIVYPIIWILAGGTGTISVEGENIAYTVLDILSKSIFGWLIVFQNWHLGAGVALATTASSVL